ncbi:MAG: hypothetical protein GY913_16310 [Proteobacteria bacterium]|nr:hypothetical protein [Pseudomonadota bacterium]MCP4918468.1 hypothetical protein [Pseudomonadota bacterium]
MALIFALSVALASEGMDAVSAGDRARWEGDRREARLHYRLALDSDDEAAKVMAHMRLSRMSGNFGLAVHGAKAETLLFTSPPSAWLTVAWADYHLLAPPQVGASPEEAARLAQVAGRALPGPALAREYMATGDPQLLAELEAATDRDGLGDALVESQGRLADDPGTWFLSLGVAGAPGAGFGGGVSWIHPDWLLKRHRLTVALAGTTRGTWGTTLAHRSPGTWFVPSRFNTSNTVQDLYDQDGARTTFSLLHLSTATGLGWAKDEVSVSGGPVVSYELSGDVDWQGVGPWASVRWNHADGWGRDRQGVVLGASSSSTLWPDLHATYMLDARGYQPFLRGVVAARGTWSHTPTDSPVWLLPSAGGSELHRGAWTNRYRAPMIATADLEQRWMIIGPLEACIFGDAAWVVDDGWHPGVGAGIRLILPPEAFNVVRFDVAVSDTDWGIYTGWGETF